MHSQLSPTMMPVIVPGAFHARKTKPGAKPGFAAQL
jgi:hypothetical protein